MVNIRRKGRRVGRCCELRWSVGPRGEVGPKARTK